MAAALSHARKPDYLIGLAQLERTIGLLRKAVPAFDGTFPHRFDQPADPAWDAAYVVIQAYLHGPPPAARAEAHVRTRHDAPDYMRARKALLTRADGAPASGYETRALHRLVIMASASNAQSWSHLLRNADAVTIFDASDLYGRTDLSRVAPTSTGTVQLEHARTRLTRFSAAYHRLYADIRPAAETLSAALLEALDHPLPNRGRQHLELELADALFFEALRLRALQALLADPAFDHVVIAHGTADPMGDFARLLSCLPSPPEDTRLTNVALPLHRCPPDAPLAPPAPHRALQDTFHRLIAAARQHAARLPDMGGAKPGAAAPLMMLNAHAPAYDASAAAYLAALTPDHPTTGVFLGGSLRDFANSGSLAREVLGEITPLTLSHRLLPDTPDFRAGLAGVLAQAVLPDTPADIQTLIQAFATRLIETAIYPALCEQALFAGLMARLKAENRLPRLVLVIPQRNPRLGLLAEEARAQGIPSLALEPHGINGNYCRYAKVAMDYYGVISGYFHATADSAFGIATDRCRVLGSPRIIAPAHHHPHAAQEAARTALTAALPAGFAEGTLYAAFFCQPSDWAHVSRVWDAILRATEGLGIHILLKPHPEKQPARITRYLDQARHSAAAERVTLLAANATQVIEASDLVLTGYSAAAIDAAVRQVPVFCVTADGQNYPIDQHIIVHSTLSNGAKALRAELTAWLDTRQTAPHQTSFLRAEPQFATSPDARLRAFVRDILDLPTEAALRPEAERPQSLFLDGPFRVFTV